MFAILMIIGCFALVGLAVRLEKESLAHELFNVIMGAFAALLGAILLIIMCGNHMTSGATITKYNSIKSSIETAREDNVSDVERAALTQKIIEVNQDIASYKYWNNTIFGGFIPDEWAELEELK